MHSHKPSSTLSWFKFELQLKDFAGNSVLQELLPRIISCVKSGITIQNVLPIGVSTAHPNDAFCAGLNCSGTCSWDWNNWYMHIKIFNCSIIIWIWKMLLKGQYVSTLLTCFKLENNSFMCTFLYFALHRRQNMLVQKLFHGLLYCGYKLNTYSIMIEQLNTWKCIF
jgi:hypothetical protein